MSTYLIQDTTLTEIADSIRTKTQETNLMTPSEMASKIASIPTESYNIEITTENGALVTITNGTDTYTATSIGTCNFTIQEQGNWTCSATLDGAQSNTKIINVSNDFATTLIFFKAIVVVTTSEGVTVTASKNDLTFTQTAPSTGIVSFIIQESGEWTFKAEKDGKNLSETINIIEEKTYNIDFPIDLLILNNNSWQKISEISKAGTARNYWSVGDCKAVHLQGTMGTLELDQTLYLFILGFDHNAETEGYGITFGGFKTAAGSDGINICLVDSQYGNFSNDGIKIFNINHWGSLNYGGWARCDLRYDILGSTDVAPQGYGARASSDQVGYAPSSTCATSPVANTLMSCLPADLRTVMKPITKYTDNVGGANSVETNISAMTDYLPLLAEFEILGTHTKANNFEQNYQIQYEYYSAGNSRVKYQHSMTNSYALWLVRSPYYNYQSYFCGINYNGDGGGGPVDRSYGIAPILLI